MLMNTDRVLAVTDLLLGAAYADSHLANKERVRVRKILRMIIADPEILGQIDQRIERFDPNQFELRTVADRFTVDPLISKRRLLELVSSVTLEDDEIDLSEDDYICELAQILGMTKDQYSDLTLEYTVEILQDCFHVVISSPPPIPGST